MLKRLTFALTTLAVLCLSAAALGQDSEKPSVRAPISGGVLNGKAISKPAPPYPAVAKAARASGVVVVQVTVDEEGSVIAARAVSGHPLLRQAAVQAAYQARFSPTLLTGHPVKVTGTITYNFVLAAFAHADESGVLTGLSSLSAKAGECEAGETAGTIVSVQRDAAGERITGLTVEAEGGSRVEVTLQGKLYEELPAEESQKVGSLLTEGRRVRMSTRDCRGRGGQLVVEDIFSADKSEAGPST